MIKLIVTTVLFLFILLPAFAAIPMANKSAMTSTQHDKIKNKEQVFFKKGKNKILRIKTAFNNKTKRNSAIGTVGLSGLAFLGIGLLLLIIPAPATLGFWIGLVGLLFLLYSLKCQC